MQTRLQTVAASISTLDEKLKTLETQVGKLQQLAVFESFRDLDWQPLVTDIERLEHELRQIEDGSDVLRTLQTQLRELETLRSTTADQLQTSRDARSRASEKKEQADALLA